MQKYINSEASQHEMKLRQLGAKVEKVSGKTLFVEFLVNGVEISYTYNINKKGKYFLERIKPYPLPIKEFDTEDDVIDLIDIDIKQFSNAVKSKNIITFIEISKQLNRLNKEFEDLYLYYNIPKEKMRSIMGKLHAIHEEIIETKECCDRVFYGKDPENI